MLDILYATMPYNWPGDAPSEKIAPFPGGDLGTNPIYGSLVPPESIPQTAPGSIPKWLNWSRCVWVVDCEWTKEPCTRSRPVYPVGRAVLGSHTRACPDLCVVDILCLIHLGEACFSLWLPFYYSNLLFLVLTVSMLISEECITDAAVWVLFLVTHVF